MLRAEEVVWVVLSILGLCIGTAWIIRILYDREFWTLIDVIDEQFRRDALYSTTAGLYSGIIHMFIKALCLFLGILSLLTPLAIKGEVQVQQQTTPFILIFVLVLLDVDSYIRLRLRMKFYPKPHLKGIENGC